MTPARRRGEGASTKLSVPKRNRSRDTLERFAAAAEELLRDRPFERITVQGIVRAAGRPIGSFYARFEGKDALLPVLYERYDRTLGRHFQARFGEVAWDELGFAPSIHVSRILLRHRRRILHDDPEAAIRFGIFLVSSVARDRLLFSEAPHAQVTGLPVARLREELVRALYAYLTTRAPARLTCSSRGRTWKPGVSRKRTSRTGSTRISARNRTRSR